MTEIFIQSKSDLITSQKTGKKYFTVTDDKENKFICWDTGLYDLCEIGSTIDLEVIPGKTPTDTPKIQKHKTQEQATEIKTPKPEMSKEDWHEKDKLQRESIESQNALTNLTNAIIAGTIKNQGAYNIWLSIILTRLEVPTPLINAILIQEKYPLQKKATEEKKGEEPASSTQLTPATTIQKEATQEVSKGIDLDWVKETMGLVKWTPGIALNWIKANLYKGQKLTATSLKEALDQMKAEKLQAFTKKLQDLKDASGNS